MARGNLITQHMKESNITILCHSLSKKENITIPEIKIICRTLAVGMHIAILNQPYLNFILEGKKTIESRLSKHKIAPYEKVHPEDFLLLKESAGPIRGIAHVASVIYQSNLTPEKIEKIFDIYNDRICANTAYINKKKESKYASLMFLDEIFPLPPMHLIKKDQRSWVTI